MKRCSRCNLLKPDACFPRPTRADVTPEHETFRSRCDSCRMHVDQMGKNSVPSVRSVAPDPEDVPLTPARLIFREELRAFRERGSRAIPRPYVYNLEGFPNAKRPSGVVSGA